MEPTIYNKPSIYKGAGVYKTGAEGGGGGGDEILNYIDGSQNDLFYICSGGVGNYPQASITDDLVYLDQIAGGEHWCTSMFKSKQNLAAFSKIKYKFRFVNDSYSVTPYSGEIDISNINTDKVITFAFYTSYSLNRVRLYINDYFSVKPQTDTTFYNLTSGSLNGIGSNARIFLDELYLE